MFKYSSIQRLLKIGEDEVSRGRDINFLRKVFKVSETYFIVNLDFLHAVNRLQQQLKLFGICAYSRFH